MGRSPGQRHPEPDERVQDGQGPMANFTCAQPQVPAALSVPKTAALSDRYSVLHNT